MCFQRRSSCLTYPSTASCFRAGWVGACVRVGPSLTAPGDAAHKVVRVVTSCAPRHSLECCFTSLMSNALLSTWQVEIEVVDEVVLELEQFVYIQVYSAPSKE